MTSPQAGVQQADSERLSGGGSRVLVLLAAYNGADYLAPQVASILDQAAVDITLVISVDKSTDGTWDEAAHLSANDPRVRLRPSIGIYGSASANFFSLMCEVPAEGFDYVALADQDDIWLPTKIARAVEILSTTESVGYSSNVWAWYDDGSLLRLQKAGRQRRWDHLFSSPGPGCTHVLRADVFAGLQQTLREHRPALADIEYHDWVDYAYVRQQGFRWFIDPTPHMLYRQHASNQLGANAGLRAKLRRAQQLRQGWMWRQARLVCEVVGAEDTAPYRLLMRRGMVARFALAVLSPLFRRNLRDAVALAVSFVVTPDQKVR